MSALMNSEKTINLDFHDSSLKLYEEINAFIIAEKGKSDLARELKFSIDSLMDALRLFGPEHLISSFNGGKDAVVIMHLVRSVFAKYSEDKGVIFKPKFIFFPIEDEFQEVLDFVDECERSYNLTILRYNCGIVKGIEQYIREAGPDKIVTFVLGTRNGDPNARDDQIFIPSSNWMPVPFMRVNPILKWEYKHVWDFFKIFNLSYCSLYDQGYTSLGPKSSTFPNPALRKKVLPNIEDKEEYLPAYLLEDGTLERSGRVKKGESQPIDVNSTESHEKIRVGSLGLIIIGDEILNGGVSEINMKSAIQELATIGIHVDRVSVIGDHETDIVEEVRRFSQRYDVVITSGGVGPTHDDVSIAAIAKAFNQTLKVNKDMVSFLQEKGLCESEESLDKNAFRLSYLPNRVKLYFPKQNYSSTIQEQNYPQNKGRNWPIATVGNVIILPGVPKFFRTGLRALCGEYMESKLPLVLNKTVVVHREESQIVESLDNLVKQHSQVKFGSYPLEDNHSTMITLRCTNSVLLESAYQDCVTLFTSSK